MQKPAQLHTFFLKYIQQIISALFCVTQRYIKLQNAVCTSYELLTQSLT